MPHQTSWETQGVVKRFRGVLSAEEFVKSAQEVAADPRFNDLLFIIDDLRDVEVHNVAEQETMEDLVGVHLGSAFTNPNIRIAFVTTNQHLGAIANRLKAMLFAQLHEMKTFATMEQARAWLASAPARTGATRRDLRMETIDILQWPDDFWCFREELSEAFVRDDNYRVILCNSDEWKRILSARKTASPRAQSDSN